MTNGHDLDRARSALQTISPCLPRDEWVRVGMAAHAAGLAFDDFDAWSAQADNYEARAARDTWRSFKADGRTGAGSLFFLARAEGWSDKGERTVPTKAAGRPAEPRKGPRPGASAADVWARCKPATDGHPYIVAKQGRPDGLRVVPDADPLRANGESVRGCLVVPVLSLADGTLNSLQFVATPEMAALFYGVIPALNCILTMGKEGKQAPGLKYGLDRVLHGEQYTEIPVVL